MKIISVEYSKTFNMGNYESVKIGYTAELNDNESPQTAIEELMIKAFDEAEQLGYKVGRVHSNKQD